MFKLSRVPGGFVHSIVRYRRPWEHAEPSVSLLLEVCQTPVASGSKGPSWSGVAIFEKT